MNVRDRDLYGYGFTSPSVIWPNGARLAVSLNLNFEEGAELAVGDGDSRNEQFGEVQSIVPAGRRDFTLEEVFGYGMRAGLPRFLSALDRHRAKATMMFCGRAVERSPEFARACVAAGHEPALHGWRWTSHVEFDDAEAERAEIRRGHDAIARITGTEPIGFMCRSSQSLHTRRLLVEEGFFYDSNALDDDLPYWDRKSGERPILILPYAFDTNDMKFYHPTGFRTPDEFLLYLRRALETLLAEAEAGATRLMSVGLHLRIAGRPARFWAVERFLEDLDALDGRVWVATRAQIAKHWSIHQPA